MKFGNICNSAWAPLRHVSTCVCARVCFPCKSLKIIFCSVCFSWYCLRALWMCRSPAADSYSHLRFVATIHPRLLAVIWKQSFKHELVVWISCEFNRLMQAPLEGNLSCPVLNCQRARGLFSLRWPISLCWALMWFRHDLTNKYFFQIAWIAWETSHPYMLFGFQIISQFCNFILISLI